MTAIDFDKYQYLAKGHLLFIIGATFEHIDNIKTYGKTIVLAVLCIR